MLRLFSVLAIATSAFAPTAAAQAAGPALDLSTDAGNVAALVKMRCSLDQDEDVILWWSGTVFAQLPQKAPSALLGFEGYNICRAEKQADGVWRMLTRELTFYRDLKTGKIIDEWDNPMTGERNSVLQVANDPVNQTLNPPGRPSTLPWVEAGDELMFTMNIPLTYPNPLPPKDFPKQSSGEMYTGSEHFMFFVPRVQMEDPARSQADVSYGWTRIGPWLPWMEMGQAPGNLLYIAQGNKKASISALPADIQERVRSTYPEYATAPREWVEPNMTSWTLYKQLHERQHEGTTAKKD
ncbi:MULTISPECIES: DUF1838 family protein [Lysobacteraceae]|uniref:DUF1838 family protein n=1 Tax=Novilysobacter avium TaxID=2781023 RepID=A0A7S6UKG5_9GAMM|nr:MULTISPECIES: DUF1838 family protein [Lysobacter]QOW21968.1 DUF1838 family protein [Lysobacter avium]QOW24438.1 DUF1838 family protein [Lysobacter sp. H23M47]